MKRWNSTLETRTPLKSYTPLRAKTPLKKISETCLICLASEIAKLGEPEKKCKYQVVRNYPDCYEDCDYGDTAECPYCSHHKPQLDKPEIDKGFIDKKAKELYKSLNPKDKEALNNRFGQLEPVEPAKPAEEIREQVAKELYDFEGRYGEHGGILWGDIAEVTKDDFRKEAEFINNEFYQPLIEQAKQQAIKENDEKWEKSMKIEMREAAFDERNMRDEIKELRRENSELRDGRL